MMRTYVMADESRLVLSVQMSLTRVRLTATLGRLVCNEVST